MQPLDTTTQSAPSLARPDYIFETSWEVCNKVGGIYTVLSTRAKTLLEGWGDKLAFIGPWLKGEGANPDFTEDATVHPEWVKAAREIGVKIKIGRWEVPGLPVALLVDFTPFFSEKDEIYGEAWRLFRVDSLKAYGDYDEASMFSYAAARAVEGIVSLALPSDAKTIYQAHEWMSGLGMLFLQHQRPEVATIFTTHATSIGRSIAGNNKELYAYFEGYHGDQMASELHMEAKHSIEKQSAWHADCFTTVSRFTDRECRQLLDKPADVVLPNGFEKAFVPTGKAFDTMRAEARAKVLNVASALTGVAFKENTFIISTSGRNDYRCKGFDVYLEALSELAQKLTHEGKTTRQILALIEVPCWLKGARADLQERLAHTLGATFAGSPLPNPFITHDLYNLDQDRIVSQIRNLAGLQGGDGNPVRVILVPCYLDGHDGIFDLPYYNILSAGDLSIYPSYYEPWGYTPLESCAFHIPCITTDLSGFGQWVDEVLQHEGKIEDGVMVAHRNDANYFELSAEIADTIERLSTQPTRSYDTLRKRAAAIADKAQWKYFISHYYEAYDFALQRAALRGKALNNETPADKASK